MKIDYPYCLKVFESHLIEDPKSIILSDTFNNHLSREELYDYSGRFYHYFKDNNIGKDDLVLINLERSIRPIVVMLALLRNASAFVVVENTYAKERIKFIKQDCKAKLEINETNYEQIIHDYSPLEGYDLPDDHDACFAVYTSGTTGSPKGVLHEYGQIKLEMLSHLDDKAPYTEDKKTRFGSVAPLNMVVSLKVFVHFLYSGGHLYVLDYDSVKSPKKLNAYFLTNKINDTFLSPSLLKMKGNNLGPFMKCVYTGSEPANDVSLDTGVLINFYTMSESFFTLSKYVIDKPLSICPIGKPSIDMDIKLLDEQGKEVATNEVGEFVFYNPYCRGYINNEVENKKHFKDHYFYTGDLASKDDQGIYTIKGRKDDMIKIDGNRIEPSEIEAAFNLLTGASLSIAKGYEKQGFIALYYKDDLKFNKDELIEKLKAKLPYYMLPSLFIKIDEVPLTSMGKVDKKALPFPIEKLKAPYVKPRDDFEEKLAKAYEQILNIDAIGIDDDFYTLGGNSIKTMELIELFDDEVLTPSMIMQGRTIAKISPLYLQAKANYLSIEEKEELGRNLSFTLPEDIAVFWYIFNNGELDFYDAFCFPGLLPAFYLAKKINEYIACNSTFNLVLQKSNDDKHPYLVYSDNTPFVEVEYKSEKEVEALRKTFVHSFTYNEPLIRIRVIRTFLHTYLFFHASHMVVDGAAMHYLADDLFKYLSGKTKKIERRYFFAWAYDENLRLQSPAIKANTDYMHKTYYSNHPTLGPKVTYREDALGMADTKMIRLPLVKVKQHCEKYNISINTFLIAATLLTQYAYNGNEDTTIHWNYDNRGPKDNKCGVMVRCMNCKIETKDIVSLNNVYKAISKQNEENFWRVRDNCCLDADYREEHNKTPKLFLSYLVDWFEIKDYPSFLFQEMKLETSGKSLMNGNTNHTLKVTHQKDDLCCQLNYGRCFYYEKDMEKFISMLEYAMNEMVKGQLPDFSSFN